MDYSCTSPKQENNKKIAWQNWLLNLISVNSQLIIITRLEGQRVINAVSAAFNRSLFKSRVFERHGPFHLKLIDCHEKKHWDNNNFALKTETNYAKHRQRKIHTKSHLHILNLHHAPEIRGVPDPHRRYRMMDGTELNL